MNDHTMDFLIITDLKSLRIGAYSIQRDDNITIDNITIIIIKCNNVRIIITTKIFLIVFQYSCIINKQISDVADDTTIVGCDLTNAETSLFLIGGIAPPDAV